MTTNEQISEVLKEGVESYLSYGGLLAKCLRKVDKFGRVPDVEYSETTTIIEFEVPFNKEAMTAIKNKLVTERDKLFINVLDEVSPTINLKDFSVDSFEALRYELEVYRIQCGKFLMNRDDTPKEDIIEPSSRYVPIHQSELRKEGYIGDKMWSMIISSPDFVDTCPIPSKTMYALPDTEYTGFYLSDLNIIIDNDIIKVKNNISIIFPKLSHMAFVHPVICPVVKGIVTGEEHSGKYREALESLK